jgi:DNA-binding response OmpR family regulator|tara:strand:- start:34 stop:228 length:195 start_codon:yes stop_codon:yes gene_type:complete
MARKTILIVDNKLEVLNAVSTLVSHKEYDGDARGEQALSILARPTFDLVAKIQRSVVGSHLSDV